jgi:hypothetical protein
VDDTLGNAVATTNLGTLTVSIPLPVPGVLAVSPVAGVSASGFAGGPFSPSAQVYTLTNSGGSPLDWTVTNSQPWVTLSVTNGTLIPGGSVPVTATVNDSAVGLSAGNYADTIQFRDLTAGLDIARSVALTVKPLPTFTLAVTATPTGWGAVSPTGGVYTAGSAVQVQATPARYFQFAGWSGDVVDTNNPLLLTVTTNRSLVAGFSEILTTNYPTPHWWLASYGYTNDFESAVTEVGVNGHALWQSYLAGLEPTNAASRLWLSGLLAADGSSLVFNWNTVTGRVYSLWGSAFVDSGFAPLPAATDLPWTVTSFTNALDAGTAGQFYRLEVRKP